MKWPALGQVADNDSHEGCRERDTQEHEGVVVAFLAGGLDEFAEEVKCDVFEDPQAIGQTSSQVSDETPSYLLPHDKVQHT